MFTRRRHCASSIDLHHKRQIKNTTITIQAKDTVVKFNDIESLGGATKKTCSTHSNQQIASFLVSSHITLLYQRKSYS